MSVSAVDRAPVEVWSNILALAVRSPLIPHPNASLAQHMALFSYGCTSERITCELAEITGRLRQVCRSWDIWVQRLQPTVVRCNFNNQYIRELPSHVMHFPLEKNEMGDEFIRHELLKCQRLEMWNAYGCNCGRACPSYYSRNIGCYFGMTRICYSPSISKRPAPYSIPPQDLARVEVLVIKGSEERWPSNLLNHIPCLKALSWCSSRKSAFLNAVIQHSFHERLTHLQVELQWADLYDRQSPLLFRHLRFLDVTLINGVHCDTEMDHLDLANWAEFPVLRYLCLAVGVTHAVSQVETEGKTERKRDEVRSLLKKVGPTLSGLMLDLPAEWKAWFTPDTWAFLPSLLEFGYGKDLPTTDHPSPPEDMHPLNILYQLAAYAPSPVETDSGTMFDDFIETCQKWRTRRITMLQTWKEAEWVLASPITEWDGRRLPKRVDFYKRLGALGVEICDRDGIRVTEAPGAHFLEALENYEVGLQAWRPTVWQR